MKIKGSAMGKDIDRDLSRFLMQAGANEAIRIAQLEFDSEEFLELSISRRILNGHYLKTLENWLPGGRVWGNRIYCCYPFEIALTDCRLSFRDYVASYSNSESPILYQRLEKEGSQDFKKGAWINRYDEIGLVKVRQVDLYAEIFGVGRKRAIEDLKRRLKIDLSRRDNVHFDRPHMCHRIRALYGDKKPPSNILGVKPDKSYCFQNTVNSVKGWGHKVLVEDKPFMTCQTPWRNRHNPQDWSWRPFAFEKPYPFYCAELVEQFPKAEVIISEIMDVAHCGRDRGGRNPRWVIVSWVDGDRVVPDLDWRALNGRTVSYLLIDDDDGQKTALTVYENAKAAGVKIESFIIWKPLQEVDRTMSVLDRPPVNSGGYFKVDAEKRVSEIKEQLGLAENLAELSHEPGGRWFGEGLNEDISEKPFLLKPFIRTGELVIIAAPKKTSKSFLTQDLSLSLASGKGFGEQFSAPKVGRVTYLDAEMGADTIQSRDKLFAGLYGVPKEKVLYTISTTKLGRNINLTQQEDREWLEREIPKGTKLLVLDNLGKLMAAYGDGNQKQWRVIEIWLRELNQRMGIILITHTTKTGAFVRGTGKILDDADTVVTLRRPQDWTHEEGNIIEFHFEASRGLHDEQLEPFSVKYTTKLGRLHREIKRIGEPFDNVPVMLLLGLNEKDFTPLEVEMLQLAYKQGEVRAKDFICKEGYPSATAVTDAFNSLLEKEVLQRKGERGSTRYFLALPLE